MQRESKINLTILLTSFFAAIVLFFLIDLFTLKYRGEGHGISGNGNFGLLFVYPAIPVYLFMLVFVYKISRSYYRNRNNITILPVIILLLLFLCVYGEYNLVQSLFRHLKRGEFPPDVFTFPWPFYQYTNTLYFNYFTFTIGVLLTLLISFCVEIFRRRKLNRTQQL
ncbi:hypothetical protein BC351_36600 [Paenibacillus ferrarius]|uniref:Uncharacterized protein n=1 Tax=Paenibacillus ferrarius TaxID=1469647 RepID=A0A1V4HC28_9BACL|nr:hypothetical protein BC351_36600 [Paenibacillus ferrarius]